MARHDHLDGIVNNAGVVGSLAQRSLDLADFDAVMDQHTGRPPRGSWCSSTPQTATSIESRDPACNVLLDANLDVKLYDFGFTHDGFLATSTRSRPSASPSLQSILLRRDTVQ
uniref:Uncharacterized protein n=1 Tax=Oryza brachyantha TaxID=4533 RepID=J3L2F3_ORYBR